MKKFLEKDLVMVVLFSIIILLGAVLASCGPAPTKVVFTKETTLRGDLSINCLGGGYPCLKRVDCSMMPTNLLWVNVPEAGMKLQAVVSGHDLILPAVAEMRVPDYTEEVTYSLSFTTTCWVVEEVSAGVFSSGMAVVDYSMTGKSRRLTEENKNASVSSYQRGICIGEPNAWGSASARAQEYKYSVHDEVQVAE
jgi:hypothetical protein